VHMTTGTTTHTTHTLVPALHSAGTTARAAAKSLVHTRSHVQGEVVTH